MTTVVALRNMKYDKGRNILIGFAIGLTAFLLYLTVSIGYNALQLQFAAVDEVYPSWHAAYRGIPESTVQQIRLSSGLERLGLRYDAAFAARGEYQLLLGYFDETCLALNKLELSAGRLPKQENEIVVSDGFLEAFGLQGELGDSILISCQIRTREGLGYAQEMEFTICGFIPAAELNTENKCYTAIVSRAFLEKNIQTESREYLVYVRAAGAMKTTEEVKQKINEIADAFGIDRSLTSFNDEYLMADYVDPSILPAVVSFLVIIVIAAIITIYNIYYISMVKNVQEYGKMKAIGATSRQQRQVVLREGLAVAIAAIPAGLLLGSLLLEGIFFYILQSAVKMDNQLAPVMKRLLDNHEISLYHGWIYVFSAIVSFTAVFLSLLKPMRIVGKIPPVEAIRFHGKKTATFHGYESINIPKLALRNLSDHRKRTVMTILSLAATGILYVAAATALACVTPKDAADNRMPGEYEIKIRNEEGNKEHPEYEWSEVQKQNPLSPALRDEILALGGVRGVDVFYRATFSSDQMEDGSGLLGLPEKYWKEVEKSIVEGSATYDDVLAGDKAVLRKTALVWYPDLKVGDELNIQIADGDETVDKKVKIIAIADIPNEVAQYENLIMAEEAVGNLCENNQAYYFHIYADKKYDPGLEQALQALTENEPRTELTSWEEEYRFWEEGLFLMNYLCFGFMAVLGAVSIMNFINTMLNSIRDRKKELGILQAIGLTRKQLSVMIELESFAYTAGTLFLSLGVGLPAGYGIFRYAKANYLLNITDFHFPVISVMVYNSIILLVQITISAAASHNIRKESLIERIRLSE